MIHWMSDPQAAKLLPKFPVVIEGTVKSFAVLELQQRRHCRTRALVVLVNRSCHCEMILLSFTVTGGKKKKITTGSQMAENQLDIWSTRVWHCCQNVAHLVSLADILWRVANYPALPIKRLGLFTGIKFYRSSSQSCVREKRTIARKGGWWNMTDGSDCVKFRKYKGCNCLDIQKIFRKRNSVFSPMLW